MTSYLSDRQQHIVVDGATSNASRVLFGGTTRIGFKYVVIPSYIDCVSLVSLSEGSRISMYADDILLSKPINYLDNCDDLQRESRNALANVI